MNWGQLRTIFWLRWRVTRNQWSRAGPLNAILTMFVVVVAVVIGAGGGLVGVLAGTFALANARPQVLLGVWDAMVLAFLFFWTIGIVSDIQRSEAIDISRMLHLPVSLRDIFLVNYLASHLHLTVILFVPGMLGLSVGLVLGKGWSMGWMLPLVLGFVFMVTAWTYCLRGWLVTLMVNKRRRRAVIAGITLAFILLSQVPYLFCSIMDNRERHRPRQTESAPSAERTTAPEGSRRLAIPQAVLAAHKVVPFLWVANGAMSLAEGTAWPALLATAGTFLIGGLGLRRAYRSTVRFYQGQQTGKRAVHRPKAEKVVSFRRNLLEKRLPGVSDEASALALAFLRSLMRAPEVKMALASSVIMLVVFGGMILFRRAASLSDSLKPFVATGAVALAFFGMLQLMFNQFGYDRAGFRALVLSPVPRRQILLGKNLALLPMAVGIGGTLLVLVKFALAISFVVVLASGLQLVAAFLGLSMGGNLSSILAPYRIAPGSLKPTKAPAMVILANILTHLLFPILMLPAFLPPALGLLWSRLGWLPAAPVNLLLSAIVLVLLALCYRLSLGRLGGLLQRREKEILRVVTQEVE